MIRIIIYLKSDIETVKNIDSKLEKSVRFSSRINKYFIDNSEADKFSLLESSLQ